MNGFTGQLSTHVVYGLGTSKPVARNTRGTNVVTAVSAIVQTSTRSARAGSLPLGKDRMRYTIMTSTAHPATRPIAYRVGSCDSASVVRNDVQPARRTRRPK